MAATSIPLGPHAPKVPADASWDDYVIIFPADSPDLTPTGRELCAGHEPQRNDH
jgi:hypothetical protein